MLISLLSKVECNYASWVESEKQVRLKREAA